MKRPGFHGFYDRITRATKRRRRRMLSDLLAQATDNGFVVLWRNGDLWLVAPELMRQSFAKSSGQSL